MRNIGVLFLAFLFVWSGPVLAGCYSPEEIEAEQLLRLHSELMVATVTCHQSSTGRDLVGAYTGFTHNHIDRLHEAEQVMIRHYRNNGSKDAVGRLDKLRTLLANEYGQRIANRSAPAFCADERDRVISLYEGDDSLMQGEVQRLMVSSRTYEPACRVTAQKTKGKRG